MHLASSETWKVIRREYFGRLYFGNSSHIMEIPKTFLDFLLSLAFLAVLLV